MALCITLPSDIFSLRGRGPETPWFHLPATPGIPWPSHLPPGGYMAVGILVAVSTTCLLMGWPPPRALTIWPSLPHGVHLFLFTQRPPGACTESCPGAHSSDAGCAQPWWPALILRTDIAHFLPPGSLSGSRCCLVSPHKTL